jgi:hypothetical protein
VVYFIWNLSVLDAELRPVFSFHPDFNEVIISDSEGRQQIHDCGSEGACNTADWVSTQFAVGCCLVSQYVNMFINRCV